MKKILLATTLVIAASMPALAANPPPPPVQQKILLIDRQAILRTTWTGWCEDLTFDTVRMFFDDNSHADMTIPPDLPLTRRIAEFCDQRAEMLEVLAPSARASALREPAKPEGIE